MGKAVVLYQSKYGATKKYAGWLKEELSCDVIETKKAVLAEILKYDIIILGGGVYAGGIAGISFIKRNYEKLKDKKIIVFTVGASPFEEKNINELRNSFLKGDMAKIPLFYCRGAWNEELMSKGDRILCSMLKKAVAKKDPSMFESWEAALMQTIGTTADWTDREYLMPVVKMTKGLD